MHTITHPHRASAAVAGEVGKLFLAKLSPAVYAVDRLEQTAGATAALLEPAHKFMRLVPKADTGEDEHSEGCIPEPGVAIVPVVSSFHCVRQSHGGSRNQCSGGVVDQ